jgi:hypothetical protein
MKEFGFTNPILVSEDGYILAGHARLKAAQKAGLKEVPIIRLPLKGAKAEAYMIADNKLQDETEWDYPTLKDLLQSLDVGELDITITGFDLSEIEDLMTQFHVGDKTSFDKQFDDDTTFKSQFGFSNSSVWVDLIAENAEIFPHLIHPPANKKGDTFRYNYSRANPVAIERIIKLWMTEGDYYYEPCCGWCAFSASAKFFGYSGESLDNWDFSVKFCEKQMKAIKSAATHKVVLGDAMASPYPDNHFDFIHMNPPFGNLEQYGGNSAGTGTYAKWLDNMKAMMVENHRVLKDDKFCVVVMGDWREKGILLNGHGDMIKASEESGFALHDLVVCKIPSQTLRFSRKAQEHRHTAKSHEYILVFRKPN